MYCPLQTQQGNESPAYHPLLEDASTQATDDDFIFLEPTRDVGAQTTDEDFILLEPIKEVSTQTTDEDFILLEPIKEVSTQTTEEDFILLEPIKETSTQTTHEDFTFLEQIQVATTETIDEDFALEPIQEASTKTIDEDFALESTQEASAKTIELDFVLEPIEKVTNNTKDEDFVLEPIEKATNNTIDEDFVLEPIEKAITKTIDEDFVLKPIQETSTKAIDEDFVPEQIEKATTYTIDEDFALEPIQEVSIKTIDEDSFNLMEPMQKASTEIIDKDCDSLMEPIQEVSTETINENCDSLETTHEASSHTIEKDVEFLTDIQSDANTSMISNKSEDRRESFIAGSVNDIPDSPCPSGIHINVSRRNSLQSSPRDFDMPCGSIHQKVPSDAPFTQSMKEVSTDNNPSYKRSNYEIYAEKSDDVLSNCEMPLMDDGKIFKLSATIQVEHEDIHLDPINNELLGGISDSETTQGDFSVNEIPGPSAIHRHVNRRNFCAYILKFWYQSEIPFKESTEDKNSICRVCKKEIPEHLVTKTDLYKCCVCLYSTLNQGNLFMHSFSHRPKKTCEICEQNYTEGDFHIGECACKVCKEKFKCRTQLEEHSLIHEDHFKTNCWVCKGTLDEHSTTRKGKKLWECCGCEFYATRRSDLKLHNKSHRPNVFCKICKEEYAVEKDCSNAHVTEYTCFVCEKSFQCQTLLEDHYVSHKKYFESNCRICDNKIRNHKTEDKQRPIYNCCDKKCEYWTKSTSNFQSHLFNHTGLRMSPCKYCGKRPTPKDLMYGHTKRCSFLRYTCEICGVRFASISVLEMHQLGKVTKT